MNKVFLVGNITADPILKQTAYGKSMVTFSLAITILSFWSDKQFLINPFFFR